MRVVYFNVYRTPRGTMYQGLATPRPVNASMNGGGNLHCYRVRVKFKTEAGIYISPHYCVASRKEDRKALTK